MITGMKGPSRAAAFAEHNSGTYNNEFHIVDYNVFAASQAPLPARDGIDSGSARDANDANDANDPNDPNDPNEDGRGRSGGGGGDTSRAGSLQPPPRTLLPHLLTVVDQMPGSVEVADVTHTLESETYWASYNRPALPRTWALANYTATVKAYGQHYSYSNCSRAQLFALLQSEIVDETTLKQVMRFNRFNDTSLPRAITHQMCRSGPSASNAISERGDLTPNASHCAEDVAQQCEAGIDLKYTTASMMNRKGLAAAAQSGPTFDDQPPFQWSTSPFPFVKHLGQPDRWEFPFVLVEW